MHKIRYIGFGLMVIVFILGGEIPGFSQQERLTVTTYYPSPYGAYSELAIYNKVTFRDVISAPAQDVELNTDGFGNLVLNVATNLPPSPAQLLFHDPVATVPVTYTNHPIFYLQTYASGVSALDPPTYCADGYTLVGFLKTDRTPANYTTNWPASGFYVCSRGYITVP